MRVWLPLVLVAAVVGGCGPSQGHPGAGPTGGDGGAATGGDLAVGVGGGGPTSDMAMALPGGDFPSAPIIDGTTPPAAPGLFGPPTSGATSGGPCLTQPPAGSLIPQNFLRPRFEFKAVGNQNLFELRIHSPAETNDLVVYTNQTTWTMPAAMWAGLATHTDVPMTVTVRGAVYSGSALTAGPALGSTGDLTVAPASAPGAIVYWAQVTSTKATTLKGFKFGDESAPKTVLTPTQAPSGPSGCIACHASTPDGTYVGFAWTTTNADGRPAQLGVLSTDGNATAPSFISASAAVKSALSKNGSTLPAFSKAHWTAGDHLMVSLQPTGALQSSGDFPGYAMISTNLETGAATTIQTGEAATRFPGAPAFSHDGNTIVYASGSADSSGYQMTDGDLRSVAFNSGNGGASVALAGASQAARNEYFPAFSPDDRFIAFTSMPSGALNYTPSNAPAEIFLVYSDGSSTSPIRLAANDPPACTSVASPGLTNSWPKWAPTSTTIGTRTFYWITFSSKRVDSATPQLFVAPVVVDGGVVQTYPALYLWNQPATEGNHTPAWDNFTIPIS